MMLVKFTFKILNPRGDLKPLLVGNVLHGSLFGSVRIYKYEFAARAHHQVFVIGALNH